jgi:15-cis-phytoene synthase
VPLSDDTVSYDRAGRGVKLASGLSPAAELVRRYDKDRFLTALFAPAEKRDALMTLYAFNHELARAREVAHEPLIALMRLQWWREVVEGARRTHEVAMPLTTLLANGELDRGDLLGMIEAREVEADPAIETLAKWRDYLLGSAGGVAVAAGRLLGMPEPELLRHGAAAYGAAGVLRSVPALARQQRCLLPVDVLAEHGLTTAAVIAAPTTERVHAVIHRLATEGRAMLQQSRLSRLPERTRAAALPAVLARRDLLRQPRFPNRRGLGDRLAVFRVAVTGVLPT